MFDPEHNLAHRAIIYLIVLVPCYLIYLWQTRDIPKEKK